MLCDNSVLAAERDALQEEIAVVVEMTQKAVAENARVAQDQEEYNRHYDGLVERYDSLKNRHEEVCSEISSREARYELMGNFIEVLTKQKDIVTEFDDSLWGSLVDHMVVRTKKDVTVVFKDGTEIKEAAEDESRLYAEGKPDYADAFADNVTFLWDSQIGKGPDSSYMRDVTEALRDDLLNYLESKLIKEE